jgi:hypothetical protein
MSEKWATRLFVECYFLKVELLAFQNRKQRSSRVWFKDKNVPILRVSTRKDMLGTEDWVARGTIQRVGASFSAAVFFCLSAALFVASLYIREEVLAYAGGGIVAQIAGAALTALVVLGASLIMFLSFRIVRGVVRSVRK